MANNIVPFTGKYYTHKIRSEEICETLVVELVDRMKSDHNFDTSNKDFLKNMAWLIKFVQVVVDDELGIANELSRELKVL